MDRVIRPILQWIALVGVQGVILREAVWFDGWFSPALHLYALLLLPLTWSAPALLIACGLTGVVLDLLTTNGGVWTSSGLLFGALLPAINRVLAPRDGYETESRPSLQDQGLGWFLARMLLLIALHELWRFGLEAGRWGVRWQTWPMALTSALGTSILLLVAQRLFTRNSARS